MDKYSVEKDSTDDGLFTPRHLEIKPSQLCLCEGNLQHYLARYQQRAVLAPLLYEVEIDVFAIGVCNILQLGSLLFNTSLVFPLIKWILL